MDVTNNISSKFGVSSPKTEKDIEFSDFRRWAVSVGAWRFDAYLCKTSASTFPSNFVNIALKLWEIQSFSIITEGGLGAEVVGVASKLFM